MDTQLNIPKTIAIGQVKRQDTYTGRLGYVIYKDEKGKLKKESHESYIADIKADLEILNLSSNKLL